MSKKELTIYHLEMNSINEFKSKPAVKSFKIIESEIKQFKLNRFLYSYVGEAWNWEKPKRVWVQTCKDDHPAALANYKAIGFKVYKTEKLP